MLTYAAVTYLTSGTSRHLSESRHLLESRGDPFQFPISDPFQFLAALVEWLKMRRDGNLGGSEGTFPRMRSTCLTVGEILAVHCHRVISDVL